jgi:hypothetical protein
VDIVKGRLGQVDIVKGRSGRYCERKVKKEAWCVL